MTAPPYRPIRPGPRRSGRALAAAVALGVGLAACGSSGHHGTATTVARSTTVPTTTTVPGVQTTGDRTVLSPIGLNVRAGPTKADRVVGTAAQGVVLTVLGYTSAAGGWYHVKGSSATGWISGDPMLSAAGLFTTYSSGRLLFNALYPATWSVAGSGRRPRCSVRPPEPSRSS